MADFSPLPSSESTILPDITGIDGFLLAWLKFDRM